MHAVARSGDLHTVVANAPHAIIEDAASLDGGHSRRARAATEGPRPNAIAQTVGAIAFAGIARMRVRAGRGEMRPIPAAE